MKVVGAFFVVLGLVVLSGAVFSYFNDGVLFSPDEKMSHVYLRSDTNPSVLVEYKGVPYWILLSGANDDSAEFYVVNQRTDEYDYKVINEGQTKKILDLRIRLVNAEKNDLFYGAEFYVTGKIIGDGGCIEPPRGLVSWWPGNSGPGPNGTKDEADGNNGVLINGVKIVFSRFGISFKFDGIDDYIEVPDADNLDVTSITIDAWVKPEHKEFGSQRIISKGISYGLFIAEENDYRCFFEFENVSRIELYSNINTSYGIWSHIACSYEENTGVAKLYVDGDVVAFVDSQDNNPLLDEKRNLMIGYLCYRDEPPSPCAVFGNFKGLIDEVEIHNVALSEEEIKAIYDAGSYGKCKEENPTHTTCEENSCVVVEGEGSNECLTNEDCTHLECVANACQIVSGQGEDECGPGKPPCGGEEWHYACVGNRGCVLTPGPGPDTCGPGDPERRVCAVLEGPRPV